MKFQIKHTNSFRGQRKSKGHHTPDCKKMQGYMLTSSWIGMNEDDALEWPSFSLPPAPANLHEHTGPTDSFSVTNMHEHTHAKACARVHTHSPATHTHIHTQTLLPAIQHTQWSLIQVLLTQE